MRKKKSIPHLPSYPGGREAINKFIISKLQYPKEAIEAQVEGTVIVRIEIDNRGIVISARVLHGIGHGCDKEAMRVCRLLHFAVKSNRNIRLIANRIVKIRFKLPEKEEDTTLNYQVTSAKKQPKQNISNGYNYTIEF